MPSPQLSPAPAATHPVLNPQDPVVEFRNVSIAFDNHRVLQDVSFRVPHGETRILLGPAGGEKAF